MSVSLFVGWTVQVGVSWVKVLTTVINKYLVGWYCVKNKNNPQIRVIETIATILGCQKETFKNNRNCSLMTKPKIYKPRLACNFAI